jgi:uncharacterized membrane protein (UPF0127 family)
MEKFYSIVFVVILATAAVMKVGQYSSEHGSFEISREKISIEIVNQITDRQKMLDWQEDMSQKNGLLFVLDKPSEETAWLEELKLPADVIWLQNGEIIDMAPNLPAIASELLQDYKTPKPATHILEIGPGFADKYGLRVGDRLEIDI